MRIMLDTNVLISALLFPGAKMNAMMNCIFTQHELVLSSYVVNELKSVIKRKFLDCQHFFRQIFLGYFPDIVQAFDTLGRNVYGDDYTSLHNPIVLSSVLLVYGMFHSTQILF
jgi:hypothetical protein